MQEEHYKCSSSRSVRVHCRFRKEKYFASERSALKRGLLKLLRGGWENHFPGSGRILFTSMPPGLYRDTQGSGHMQGTSAPRSLCAMMAAHPLFICESTRNFGEGLHHLALQGGCSCFRVTVCVIHDGKQHRRKASCSRYDRGSPARRSAC